MCYPIGWQLLQTLNLSSGPGQPENGLSFLSFTVDVNLPAVPEPSAFLYGGLVAVVVVGGQWASRRRFR